MKVFLDSNIWLRLFLKDIEEQYTSVVEFLSSIESGKFKSYTSSLVLLEVNFILERIYELDRNEIFDIFTRIKSVRGLTIIEKTNLKLAFEYYQKYNLKFPDCLIVSQLPKGAILVTFDKDFSKIKEIKSLQPKEVYREVEKPDHI